MLGADKRCLMNQPNFRQFLDYDPVLLGTNLELFTINPITSVVYVRFSTIGNITQQVKFLLCQLGEQLQICIFLLLHGVAKIHKFWGKQKRCWLIIVTSPEKFNQLLFNFQRCARREPFSALGTHQTDFKINTQKLLSPIVFSFPLLFSFARPTPASSIWVCRFQCSFRR